MCELAHWFHGCSLVAPSLHKEVENLAFVINRASEPELRARNHHGHLVEMPLRRWPRASTAKFSGEQRPELQYQSPHRLVGDIQTALREQIFDVAIAERETCLRNNALRLMCWWRTSCALTARRTPSPRAPTRRGAFHWLWRGGAWRTLAVLNSASQSRETLAVPWAH